jgi:cell division protease FtsH
MNSTVKAVVFWFVIVMSAFLLWQVVRSGSSSPKIREIGYSYFLSDVESGKVAEITLSKNHVDGKYQDGTLFSVTVPASQEGMLQTLRENNVNIFVRDEPSENGPKYLLNLAPMILLVVLWFFMIRQLRQRQVQPQISKQPV